jgi:transcriptional regulator with XRE-family HTH domain
MTERRKPYDGYIPTEGRDTFIANLRAVMEREGVSQTSLAEKIGKPQGRVSKVLSGKAGLSHDLACAMARAAGKGVEELSSSREIDSWLTEHFPTLEEASLQQVIEDLPVGMKWELRAVIEQLEEKSDPVTK